MKKENNGISKEYNGLTSRTVTKLSTEQMARVFGAEGGGPNTETDITSTTCPTKKKLGTQLSTKICNM